jgi:hypothetical protein
MTVHTDVRYISSATVTAQPYLGSTAVGSALSTSKFADDGATARFGVDLTSVNTSIDSVTFIVGGKGIGDSDVAWDGVKLVTNIVLQGEINGAVGSGPNTILVTVKDGSGNLLTNASISANSNGVKVASNKTDNTGTAPLFISNGTFQIAALCSGFNGNSQTITVSSNQSIEIDLTQFTPEISATGLVTGYLTCYDQSGNPLSGIVHTLVVVELPIDAVGLSINVGTRTITSGSGMNNVQFADLVPGGQYSIQRANGVPTYFEALETNFPIAISGAVT